MSEPKTKYRVNILKFLNKDKSGTACIQAQVQDTSNFKDHQERYSDYCETTLDISDCSRKIYLDLSMDDKQSFNNTIHKLDLIIDTITKVKEALVIEFALKEKRAAIRKKRKTKS
jgi:hypothetical protein